MMLAAGLRVSARPTLPTALDQTHGYDDRRAGRGAVTTAEPVPLTLQRETHSSRFAGFHVYDDPRRQVLHKFQKFTSKERDAETGLDFFLARYYSGAQGRFTSPDEWAGGIVDPFTGQQVGQPGPLPYADITDPQTLNKYAYVRNNPLRYTDPDGHVIDTLADIGFIAYDIYDIAKNGATTTSVLALGADVVGAVVPFATGLGAGVRAAHAVEAGVHTAEAGMHVVEGGVHAAEAGKVAKAEAAGGDKLLYRRGAHDSEKVLKTQAQAAESAGLPHGVSVSTSPAAKPGQVVRCATCSSVEAAGFKVHKTGSDPSHHTVELPKPITKRIAEKWNELFK